MSLKPIETPGGVEVTSKDYYFDSYSHYSIHEEMLKDSVRTQTYRKAIQWNEHIFKNKVVIDVGCGTGILSLFAAQAGARRVFAIECSNIADSAKKIVQENKFEHIITVIKSKIEDIKELPDNIKQVDIIISEWMGYCLFYESMLDSILYARDRWLKPQVGLLFPDKATLYLTAIEDRAYKKRKFDFWDDVYGFKMSCIKDMSLYEPLVDNVAPKQILAEDCVVKSIDLYSIKASDLTFESEFKLHCTRDDYLSGFMTFFDVEFSACHTPTSFTTKPDAKRFTHWKQTVFYLDEDLIVQRGNKIPGTFKMTPNAINRRDLDIEISVNFIGKFCRREAKYYYKMR